MIFKALTIPITNRISIDTENYFLYDYIKINIYNFVKVNSFVGFFDGKKLTYENVKDFFIEIFGDLKFIEFINKTSRNMNGFDYYEIYQHRFPGETMEVKYIDEDFLCNLTKYEHKLVHQNNEKLVLQKLKSYPIIHYDDDGNILMEMRVFYTFLRLYLEKNKYSFNICTSILIQKSKYEHMIWYTEDINSSKRFIRKLEKSLAENDEELAVNESTESTGKIMMKINSKELLKK